MIDKISKIAYSFPETVQHTFDSAFKCMKLQGCFVECGVGAGAQLAAMQLANNYINGKKIYGFDSFRGIPLASVHDVEQPGIGKPKHDVTLTERERLVSSGVTVHSKKTVLHNIRRLGLSTTNIHLIEGWFQDTVPNFKETIVLLRLDGDLYESTKVCLKYLYPQVVKGGIVIIDDYALAGCRKAVDEYFGNENIRFHKLEPKENGVHWFYKP